MAGAFPLTAPGGKAVEAWAAAMLGKAAPKTAVSTEAQTRATAQEFEAVFLNTMFQQMFTGIDGEGPFGGQGPGSVWRSMLTDEYSKTFSRAGGIGIADHVYRTLMAQQEVRP